MLITGVIILVAIVAVYFILKRTSKYWLKPVTNLLFPIGYRLYVTRLGYAFHLRSLNKRPQLAPHSLTQPVPLLGVHVEPVAILGDNYSYFVIDPSTKDALVVDPADPVPITRFVTEKGLRLKAILTTHKHWDHAGGNLLLKRQFPNLAVYGGAGEPVAGVTRALRDNDSIQIGAMTIDVLFTPGHTTGHVVYLLRSEPPCLFTGDLLFIGGMGQIFEGSAEQMLTSLERIKQLPRTTLIFPGHEYTFNNIRFAAHLLPTHTPVQLKWQWVKQQRARKLSTVPSILSEENQYNPFLMIESDVVREALGLPDHTPRSEVLSAVRLKKNNFQPST